MVFFFADMDGLKWINDALGHETGDHALINLKDRTYKLSISVGCACFDPENPCSIDELMLQADKLMYAQKQRRKNGDSQY